MGHGAGRAGLRGLTRAVRQAFRLRIDALPQAPANEAKGETWNRCRVLADLVAAAVGVLGQRQAVQCVVGVARAARLCGVSRH